MTFFRKCPWSAAQLCTTNTFGWNAAISAELLALLLLAGWAAPKRLRSESCAGQARGRGLAAGVGIGAGVEHHDLDRRRGREQPREGAEADVVGRPVAAHADHGRHQRQFLRRELGPAEGSEEPVVHLRIVVVVELEPGDAQRPDVAARLRAQPLEHALGDRRRVLEQAVDPRIVVRVEREGRGVDARAAGGVGDHRAGRPVARVGPLSSR